MSVMKDQTIVQLGVLSAQTMMEVIHVLVKLVMMEMDLLVLVNF